MRHTLVLTILAGAVYAAVTAANQVDGLRTRMERAQGYLQADTDIEKDAALYPEKFRLKFSDPASIEALDALRKEIERLAPRWSFPAGPHDGRIEGFVRKGVADW